MGWMAIPATYYTNKGLIDRKAQCDAYFLEGLNRGHFAIKKSALVGSVYYAAVTTLLKSNGEDKDGKPIYEPIPEQDQTTWAVILLTSVNKENYGFEFGFKSMDETVGPYYFDCPMSILKLLSPTDSEYAMNWRKKCMEFQTEKKAIHSLPIGTSIKVKDREYVKIKRRKRSMWVNFASHTFLQEKSIMSMGYTVLTN